jgi:flagellin-like protein
MRKGITPIIAVIILLLITVALAGMAWAFLNNYFTGMTGKNIQLIDYSCIGGNNVRVVLRNAGTQSISTASCSVSSNVISCTDVTVVKSQGGSPGQVNGGTGFGATNSILTGEVATFNDTCATGTSCTYRFTTTTGVGPSPNVATVNC